MIGKFLKLPHTSGVQLVFSGEDRDHGAPSVFILGRRSRIQRYAQHAADKIPGLAGALAVMRDGEPTTISHVVVQTPAPPNAPPNTPPTTTTRRITLCFLPCTASRYNNDIRPDAIAEIIARHCRLLPPGSFFEIHIVIDEPSQALPAGLAIAKALPLYSRKSLHSKAHAHAHDDNKPTVSKNPASRITVCFGLAGSPRKALEEPQLDLIEATADGTRLAAYLVDAPCEEMHTDLFATQCRVMATALGGEANGVFMRVIRGEELLETGLNLLYNVGKAAEHPSNLVVLTYVPPGTRPDESSSSSFAMVGKGIVFDTGGSSCVKTVEGMRGMKRDMGGAAAVLGAFQTIVRQRLCRYPVHAVLCLAENQVSEKATRIDDILVGYSGKSVEINNTDAEGRLVIADGVSYAIRILNAKVVVDVATLTGTQAVATGRKIAALYSSSETLEKLAAQSGKMTGDLCHPLPYMPEFWREHLVSDVADMKNAASRRDNCPSACAAQFIEEHIPAGFGENWIHVDIAGPSAAGDRGTGFGVGLLVGLVDQVDSVGPLVVRSPSQEAGPVVMPVAHQSHVARLVVAPSAPPACITTAPQASAPHVSNERSIVSGTATGGGVDQKHVPYVHNGGHNKRGPPATTVPPSSHDNAHESQQVHACSGLLAMRSAASRQNPANHIANNPPPFHTAKRARSTSASGSPVLVGPGPNSHAQRHHVR